MVDDVKEREKGPVEILCSEIGFRFDQRLERTDLFVSFVSVLVGHVAAMREMKSLLSENVGTEAPSDDSGEVLRQAEGMLTCETAGLMLDKAADIHSFIHEVAPDDAYPCDHLIDMLSSCVSAIRFGLEVPCRSRHAAGAASHIWKHVYGVTLFDSFTPKWKCEWARAQFQEAIFRCVPGCERDGYCGDEVTGD